jgi:hypothetical protein
MRDLRDLGTVVAGAGAAGVPGVAAPSKLGTQESPNPATAALAVPAVLGDVRAGRRRRRR